MEDQSRDAFLNEIQHQFEIGGVTVVGIRQGSVSEKQVQFVTVLGRTEGAQIPQVGVVCGEDQVKAFKIGGAHTACPKGSEVIPAAGAMPHGTGIRGRPDVVSGGAC